MDEKTRDEAIRLLLIAVMEAGPSVTSAETVLDAYKLVERIVREEQMPAEAR